jgi:peptidyl-prolyl cis-trans isomerase B (cyclophilin B)
VLRRLALLLPALAAVGVLSACGCTGSPGASPSTSARTDTVATPLVSASASAAACTYTRSGSAARTVDLPPSTPSFSGQVPVTIHTSVGDLHLTLDADKAPCTVNSFVSLAQQGYFDHTHCHRLGDRAGFRMLQCGDPTGTGSGGPGYTFDDELTGHETYPAGTVAMANAEAPNTNGSQFFLVFGDTDLKPDYTVFGTMDGTTLALLRRVAAHGIADPGADGTGEPEEKVAFTSVTID